LTNIYLSLNYNFISKSLVNTSGIILKLPLFIRILISISTPILFYSFTATAQIIPDVSVDCEDNDYSIDVSPIQSSRSTTIYCFVENPSNFQQEVDLFYQSSNLSISGPSSVVIDSGQSKMIVFSARAQILQESGDYTGTLTATVRNANGIPISAASQSDSDDFTVIIEPTTSCEIYKTPESIEISNDNSIEFDSEISCNSNLLISKNFQFVLIEYGIETLNPDPVYWPKDFTDTSPPCDLEIGLGYSSHNCTFSAVTDRQLYSSLNSCISIYQSGENYPTYCDSNSITINTDILTILNSLKFTILILLTITSIPVIIYRFSKNN